MSFSLLTQKVTLNDHFLNYLSITIYNYAVLSIKRVKITGIKSCVE